MKIYYNKVKNRLLNQIPTIRGCRFAQYATALHNTQLACTTYN
ncbi:hypothetical protein HMPREF9303_0775 [Prevotella denticola CRIS 18C-A]|uniref:Uncharacterized protein n=1 Tax=Prevotella denticola CRIS 18C-A TaxID=944557 RepID=F0H434_9BACT|nr:hypothetical protein HMPREF9303_0775 [Prevotella denticola CRIS 18C-A]